MTPIEVLAIPMLENDAGAVTVRDYLKELLVMVWTDGESFSGKRPFGNSGWESELYLPLVKAGAIKGTIDPDGWLEDFDQKAGNDLIHKAIKAL